ncbi:nucleotide exchange factor GrpE [Chloroflexota bacterium]
MIEQGSEDSQNSLLDTDLAEAEDMETLKKALAEEKEKAEGHLANWQRAQADFINYKRRIEQEKEEASKFSSSTLMLSILPALDDLERAFASVPPKLAKLNWVDGIRLIERKLRASLEAQGVSQIKALGELFDPHLHEAVRQDRGKEGIVVEELQKGYMLHDRVIRPTKVVVGNSEEAEEKEE